MKTNPTLLAVVVAGTIAAMVCGFYLGQSTQSSSPEQAALQAEFEQMKSTLPLRLQAGSASGGKTISMATGSITNEVESLFILDHLTGKLQCWLLNPRSGDVGGIYVANVNETLELDKGEPDFVMTTGDFFFRQSNASRLANTVCYVGDGKSGKVVGYSLAYNKAGFQKGVIQQGELSVICKGPIRQAGAVRE